MKKSVTLSTCLIGLGLLIFLVSIFCFFGQAIRFPGNDSANMFAYMFGTIAATNYQLNGLIWVFGLQLAKIALIAFVIFAMIKKDFPTMLIMVLVLIICVFSLIGLILSFNTIDFYREFNPGAIDLSLGSGPISYSVLNIIGIVISLSGLFFLRKGM